MEVNRYGREITMIRHPVNGRIVSAGRKVRTAHAQNSTQKELGSPQRKRIKQTELALLQQKRRRARVNAS
jgi:hypothetical protein